MTEDTDFSAIVERLLQMNPDRPGVARLAQEILAELYQLELPKNPAYRDRFLLSWG